QKYSTLPKFGITLSMRHPGPSGRGDRTSQRTWAGERWTRQRRARGAGPGRDEPREVFTSCGTNGAKCQAKPLGAKPGKLRTAKPCGPDRRRYGQALRRWLWARPGLKASRIRKTTEARTNSAPGRAGISRQPIAQGRPGVFRPTRFPARAFALEI